MQRSLRLTGCCHAGNSFAPAEHQQAPNLQVFCISEQLSEGPFLPNVADSYDAYLAMAGCICKQTERECEISGQLHSLPASHRSRGLWPQGEERQTPVTL